MFNLCTKTGAISRQGVQNIWPHFQGFSVTSCTHKTKVDTMNY